MIYTKSNPAKSDSTLVAGIDNSHYLKYTVPQNATIRPKHNQKLIGVIKADIALIQPIQDEKSNPKFQIISSPHSKQDQTSASIITAWH